MPEHKIYVEPFAGLGRTAKYVKAERYILNDKSEFAFGFLSKHFNAKVTNLDFVECIKLYDSKDTFFLFDPPWRFTCYDSNDKAYCDRTPYEYYTQLLELIPFLEGDWIICSAKDEHEIKKILTKTDYYKMVVKSDKPKVFGKHAQVLLVSNKSFEKQGVHQTQL